MATMAAGRPPGNGSNTYALTTAPCTRRFGSHVTVTNKANGRSVRVRITDRGSFIKGRCIELSRAAANAIGMGGTARVNVLYPRDEEAAQGGGLRTALAPRCSSPCTRR